MSRETHTARRQAVTRDQFAKLINSMEPDELHTLRRLVEETMATPGWDRLMDMLDWKRDEFLHAMVHHAAMDHAKYIAQTSMVAGMDFASFLAAVVVEKDDEQQAAELAAREEEYVG